MGPVTLSFTSAVVQCLLSAAVPEAPVPLPGVEPDVPEVAPVLELAVPVVPDVAEAGAEDAGPAAEDEPVPDPLLQAVSARPAVSVAAAAAIRRVAVRMVCAPRGQGFLPFDVSCS
ncbi:hypothetical protein ACFV4P_24815 [Kitasatospora sp. NPDC059795]|uniref:hypothetical protein n=1 Tax=Kitasatospora sp. NPDC059795 TaxID=3346949 RepID=UPI003661AF6B